MYFCGGKMKLSALCVLAVLAATAALTIAGFAVLAVLAAVSAVERGDLMRLLGNTCGMEKQSGRCCCQGMYTAFSVVSIAALNCQDPAACTALGHNRGWRVVKYLILIQSLQRFKGVEECKWVIVLDVQRGGGSRIAPLVEGAASQVVVFWLPPASRRWEEIWICRCNCCFSVCPDDLAHFHFHPKYYCSQQYLRAGCNPAYFSAT